MSPDPRTKLFRIGVDNRGGAELVSIADHDSQLGEPVPVRRTSYKTLRLRTFQ